MSTTTRTGTETTTVTAGDIRKVMSLMMQEIETICRMASRLATDFDVASAKKDLSMLVLNDIISAVRLQVYVEADLVTEYCFRITPKPVDAYGPAPDQPPLGLFPEGARIRLVASHNTDTPAEERTAFFASLGWSNAEPLRVSQGMRPEVYGAYRSGGISIERSLMVNKQFDRPTAPNSLPSAGKERW